METTEREHLRTWLKRCQAVLVGNLCNGFLFDEELSGPDGAHFTLFVPERTDRAEIDKAEADLRNRYDVTGFTVERVPADILAEFLHTTAGKPEGGWIVSARWIVENKQARKIDAEGNFIDKHKAGGQLCDLWTASRMVAIYDSLQKEENRVKFHNMSFAVAHHVAMKL
ncbi:MAG: hypothetical protein M0Q24_11025 [Sulfurimonas sp.]|uniref:hypothetical protein n=1 Tax=Sulfurimonas sp. TaxID=2022749 RepID=UPI0025D820FF|nr:hypothetical protein [Sulfurimonas sp.]MCK9492606.1 hypothetical protein [Sulfurimonas sp.]